MASDSAGVPWQGRHFEASTSAFEDDDGTAPAELASALSAFQGGTATERDVIDAVRDARLLVALVAHAGDTDVDEHGRTIDKTQELSIVTVEGPDGRRVMPVFTSTEAMRAWNPSARPVPTLARRIALAAAAENTDVLVVDPRSPTEFAIRRPAVWAIAQNVPWNSPIDDPEVAAVFEASVTGEPAVESVAVRAGDPRARLVAPEVAVELTLYPGLGRADLNALLIRLNERWSASDLIAGRVDSLAVRLLTASD